MREAEKSKKAKVLIMKKTMLILLLALVVLTAGFAAGCAAESEPNDKPNVITSQEEIDAYLAPLVSKSDAIKTSLEQDPLTQTEMNLKAEELCELWDGALDYFIGILEERMSEDEFAKLQDEQVVWTANRDKAAAEAGKDFEGGSLHSFIVASEYARITEERVSELYGMYEELK